MCYTVTERPITTLKKSRISQRCDRIEELDELKHFTFSAFDFIFTRMSNKWLCSQEAAPGRQIDVWEALKTTPCATSSVPHIVSSIKTEMKKAFFSFSFFLNPSSDYCFSPITTHLHPAGIKPHRAFLPRFLFPDRRSIGPPPSGTDCWPIGLRPKWISSAALSRTALSALALQYAFSLVPLSRAFPTFSVTMVSVNSGVLSLSAFSRPRCVCECVCVVFFGAEGPHCCCWHVLFLEDSTWFSKWVDRRRSWQIQHESTSIDTFFWETSLISTSRSQKLWN